MSTIKARLKGLLNSPVFIALSIAVLFGNIVGYLATRNPTTDCTAFTSEARQFRLEADLGPLRPAANGVDANVRSSK